MKNPAKNHALAYIFSLSAAAVFCSESAFAQSRYDTLGQILPYSPYKNTHTRTHTSPYKAPHSINYGVQTSQPRLTYRPNQAYRPLQSYRPAQTFTRAPVYHAQNRLAYRRPVQKGTPIVRQQRTIQTSPKHGTLFQRWVETESHYRFYPGDQLDIVVPSAPELSRTLTVGPDGRISMPMVQPVMAAGRTLLELQNALRGQLATQLRDPTVAVTPRAFAPAQIYVGGSVTTPGTYAAPGPIGVMEAVIMAGGPSPTSNAKQVAVLRRGANGGMMMRTVNLKKGMKKRQSFDDNIQLRRGDIVFVPRSTLGEIGVFVQNFRNAMPVDFNLSYQFFSGGDGNGTTILTP